MVNLITDHMDVWTSALRQKTNGAGRGNHSAKHSLHGIKKLRELILELAVQGKLVPQEPNDEPASVLLENIAREKARLIKEGKIKKQDPLPEITDDEKVFELPSGWVWVRLGSIGETNIGLTYSPKDISDIGTPVLRSNNVQKGKLNLTDLVRVNIELKNSVIVQEGDLLICARNGSKALVGKTAQVTGLPEEMAFGAFMAIFRSLVNDYVLCFINSPLFRKMIDDVNTTTINQITQNNLKTTMFPLPPLAEQQRIVAKVDELMAICEQLEQQQTESNDAHQTLVEKLLATLTNATNQDEFVEAWQRIAKNFDILLTTEQSIDLLKQKILQLAVIGKLVPQNPNDEPASVLLEKIAKEKARLIKEGKIKKEKPLPEIGEDEKPFELPQGWEWTRLGSFSEIKGGKRLPAGHSFSPIETPFIYIQVTNMKDGGIMRDNLKYLSRETQAEISQYTIFKSDLYITIAGTIGFVGIVPDYFDCMNLTENAAKIVFIHIDKTWLQKSLSSETLQRQFTDKTNQLAQPKLALHRIASSCIALPPLAEQQRIVAKVDELMALCDTLKACIRDAQTTQIQLADAIVEQAVA